MEETIRQNGDTSDSQENTESEIQLATKLASSQGKLASEYKEYYLRLFRERRLEKAKSHPTKSTLPTSIPRQEAFSAGEFAGASPDEDIDDAWRQHDEEKAAGHAEDKPTPKREPVTNDSLDDIYQNLRDEYSTEPSEPIPSPAPEEPQPDEPPPEEAEPTPEVEEPQAAATPVAKAVESAVRHRRPRRPVVPRTMPHGNSTGVWLPREVWEDSRFESTDERVLYLEVNHLDKEDGCTATNRHFAEYLGCSIQTIQDMIQEMTGRGIFTCSYPSRRSRIIHIAGGRRDYSRHHS